MNRLTTEEQDKIRDLVDKMGDPAGEEKDVRLAQYGEFLIRTDSYHPLSRSPDPDSLPCNHDLPMKIWNEAAELRRTGVLLPFLGNILSGSSDSWCI